MTAPASSADPVNLWSESAWAQRYLRERDDIPHRTEGFAVLMEVLPPTPRRVLDLGTGDGYALGLVRGAHPEAEGVGVDFSAEMLGRARERFAGDAGVEIVEHDLDVPLPALGTFDLVVSSFAIHHCVDERKRALYGEVFGVLEPGGRFLNLEHVDSATPELHVDFLAAIGKTPAEDDPSNKLVAVETQLTWLREIGFVDVDCYWKWRELALLAGVKPA
ncbi:MAG TPA: class I SAM-dependent methyltransferase [Acidimicrobiia bacterium]|nr:class I SAM-dependent methyltransferase [Acidimicrobiia bacterium]